MRYWVPNRRISFPLPFHSSSLESSIPSFYFQISFSPLGAISWKFNRVSVRLLGGLKEKVVVSWLLSFCRAAALVVWSAKEFLLASEVLTLKFPDILMIANALDNRIISSNSATCLPFLIGCPENARNPLFFPKYAKIKCYPKSIAYISINVSRFPFCQLAGSC